MTRNQAKKHIVIVTPYFSPKIGGVENYSEQIARGIAKEKDYSVSIITSSTDRYSKETLDGIEIHRLPVLFSISNTPINPMWYFWFKKYFETIKPSIIHVHSPVPFMADVAAFSAGKIPVILTYHAGSMKKGKIFTDLIIDIYEKTFLRLLFKKATAIVVVSSVLGSKILNRFKDKLYYIPPGVDMTKFSASKVPHSGPIVYVGRIEHSSSWKGINVLIDAMKIVCRKNSNAKLILVGSGDAVSHYCDVVASLGLQDRISFVGQKTGSELVHMYHAASMIVLPSVSNAESFGMTLIEAMASGRPVVGSRIGGIPEVIDHQINGLLVPPNNPTALADAISSLFSNPELMDQYGNAGSEKAKQFSWDIQINRYKNLFDIISADFPPIAHIIGYFPPHTGGMEVVGSRLSQALAQTGYNVEVFTSRYGAKKTPNKELHTRLKIRRLAGLEFAHTPILLTLPLRLLTLKKGTILHVHVAHAGLPELAAIIAFIRNFPLVMHFHLDVGPSGGGAIFLNFYKKYFLGTALRFADKVIVLSQHQKVLINERYGVRNENISIVPNAVGEEYFFTGTRPQRSNNTPKLLFVGRLSTQKRIDRLIDMLAILKSPCHLTIVGDGDEEGKLIMQTKRLGLNNITFVGKKFGKELIDEYHKADIFVIASDVEGMPLVVLEAMAAGLPIVASDVLGLHELVQDVGVLVNEPYVVNFAKAVENILNDHILMESLQSQSTNRALQQTWGKTTQLVIGIYNEIKHN